MRRILALIAVLLLGPVLFSVPARADQAGAQALVKDLADQVLAVLKSGGGDKNARLQQVFEGHVDINWVGQFVLGTHWRQASPEKRQEYLAAYKAFVIGSYSSRLENYTGETYKITSTQPTGEGRYKVSMEINRPQGAPVKVDYRLREGNGTYLVYDLQVEGVSLITTQRSEFDAVVKRSGLDYLIAQLKSRAANPSAKPPV